MEKLLGWLPRSIQKQIDHVTEEALAKALNVAMKTIDDETVKAPWNLTHKVAATISGVTGGLFGAPALFAELPVTTVIILRSIARRESIRPGRAARVPGSLRAGKRR